MPTVSLIMAVFNGKEFLPATMASILGQTMGDFEFIIIDDGSTDGVTDLLRDYAANDSRIRLIVQKNKGLTPTLNDGLRMATAPLIARIDADDIARHDRLAKQVAFINAHPEVVLLGGAYELIDQHGRLLRTFNPPLDDTALQAQCLAGTTPICHPLAMFRREAALAVGLYDESFQSAQDIDLWLRLGEAGKMACLADVLLQYRMHEKSISESKQAQQVANMTRACELAWKRRGLSGKFKQAGTWRAGGDKQSKFKQHIKYGWWALGSGESATARAYGLSAIRESPFSADGWKLLACGFFKPVPKRS